MNKTTFFLLGLGLLLAGLLGLAGELLLPVIGLSGWILSRLWPLLVIGPGLVLFLMGCMGISRRALGSLFIPAVPLLTTGGILLFASLFRFWSIWSLAWPFEILAVALGFLLAAIFMRQPWLLLPAFLTGINGLVLLFCNVTGWWSAWSFLWSVEPLALGLAFLVIGLLRHSSRLVVPGVLLSGFAVLAAGGLGVLYLMGDWVWRFWPLALVLSGLLLLGGSLMVPGRSKVVVS